MLKIDDISYSIQGRQLFDGAGVSIPDGHKVGIVGRNGTGKTTLFKLIRGELSLDGGTITMPKGKRWGGVAQEVPSNEVSLLDTVIAADTERAELMVEAETATDPNRISEIHIRLADIDAWSAEGRASAILKGLGFDSNEQLMPCSAFSGGWRMRVALAAVLFAAPDLLLLDEPTNYLDLEGAVWLETYLAKYPHTVMIISHDRGLLNRSVGAILHLDNQKLTLYNTPYDLFVKQRAEQRAVQAAAAQKQATAKAHMQAFVDRFKAKASKAKQAQSRVKAIERMVPISSPEEAAQQRFSFPEPEELSPPIINMENASVGYGDDVVLRGLDLRIDQDDRIALLGKNGQGKSTLSKLLADRLAPMTGDVTRSRKLRIGYFAQHQIDELQAGETPLEHLTSLRPGLSPSKLRAMLAGFGLPADTVNTVVTKLSGGQKARLSLLLATLDAPHLLILDEPTNHLDIESREGLVEALTAYSGAVVLVSHDMHLLSLVADRLWLVQDGKVQVFEDDLKAYRKMLLASPNENKASAKAKNDAAQSTQKSDKSSQKKTIDNHQLSKLQKEVAECEGRIEKLEEMREKVDAFLADPTIYNPERRDDMIKWQGKQTEVAKAVERAEKLWEEAVAALEAAK